MYTTQTNHRPKKAKTEYFSTEKSEKYDKTLTTLIMHYENAHSLYCEMYLDHSHARLSLLNARNRKDLGDKYFYDLLAYNKGVKLSIQDWVSQNQQDLVSDSSHTPPKKPIIQANEQKLPSITSIPKKFQNYHTPKHIQTIEYKDEKKRTVTIPLKSPQYLKNQLFDLKSHISDKQESSRLHAPQKLRAILEIKILQENKVIVISNRSVSKEQQRSISSTKAQINNTSLNTNYFLRRLRNKQIYDQECNNNSKQCKMDKSLNEKNLVINKF